jgi:hypothetical protein
MAAANTGREMRSSTTVIKTDQTNNGMRSRRRPFIRILIQVDIKFTAPKIEEAPAKCNEKIVKSTDGPAWAKFPASGWYTVQPVPAPLSTAAEDNSKVSEGGNNQNLILFKRGKAISGAPNIRGNIQLPNPPIAIGITKKKIITNA